PGALDSSAERSHGVGRAEGVLALQHSGNVGLADGKRAQNQRTQRNRLVARHPDATGHRSGAAGRQWRGSGLFHGGSVFLGSMILAENRYQLPGGMLRGWS